MRRRATVMSRLLSRALVAGLLTGLAGGSAAAQPVHIPKVATQDIPPPDQILRQLASWLPGVYANADQLKGYEDDEDAHALTTIVKPLSNPVLGQNLYYLEEFRDNDPTALTRIRIYEFLVVEDRVRLRLLNPKDTEALQGDHATLSKAMQLTHDDISPDRDSCLLDLTTYNGTLLARMRHQACDVQDTWVDYEWVVDPAGTWTCYARRMKRDDSLTWLQMPAFPCIRQTRTALN